MTSKTLTRDQAWQLLTKYNQESFHLKHAQVVEGVMRYFAEQNGCSPAEIDFWGEVGLLHDLDFEQYPSEHCLKTKAIMEENQLDEKLIKACISHGFGLVADDQKVIPEPDEEMTKILFAVDELTGLIGAVALMRPSRSVQDLELKSVKKKFKQPSFAAGCSREVITCGAEKLGWELDDLIKRTILAMRTLPQDLIG